MLKPHFARLVILFLVFFVNLSLFAQEHHLIQKRKIDSLAAILQKQSSSDTLTAKRMNDLSVLYLRETQLDLAISFAH